MSKNYPDFDGIESLKVVNDIGMRQLFLKWYNTAAPTIKFSAAINDDGTFYGFLENEYKRYASFANLVRNATIEECANYLSGQVEDINDGSIAAALDIYLEHIIESIRSRIKS